MHRFPVNLALTFVLAASVNVACGDDRPAAAPAAQQKPAAAAGARSPGKPAAPITLDYEVLGKPLVGLPVAINVHVNGPADLGPVAIRYSINDASALRFQAGQVESLVVDDLGADDTQQVTVVPQREGRLYVNVAVEIETDGGAMIKSMAIPIQVGSAPERGAVNGELQEGPDGEAAISMPAVEN